MAKPPKQRTADDIMRLISLVYTPRTAAYQRVREGLQKLDPQERQCLYAMLLTAIPQRKEKETC